MNKEMAGKKSRRVHPKKRSTRRKTLRRRKVRRGGADSQSITMPDKSFSRPIGTPEETSWFMPK